MLIKSVIMLKSVPIFYLRLFINLSLLLIIVNRQIIMYSVNNYIRRFYLMSKTLLLYTRQPLDSDIYDAKLAYSMHLAIGCEEGYKALNHNSGVFFAKATENPNGSLNPKSLKAPFAFKLADGRYGILAVRTNGDGSPDEQSKGSVLFAVTEDFLKYKEIGLIKLCDEYIQMVRAKTCDNSGVKICFRAENKCHCCLVNDILNPASEISGLNEHEPDCDFAFMQPSCPDIEGIVPSWELEISDEIAKKLVNKLTTPTNISIEFPAEVRASSEKELRSVKACAHYSDGSTDEKKIDWNLDGVDFSKPGKYEITGEVHQDHYAFPIAVNRADPCVAKWEGKYYFIATNDADGNHTLYIRQADSIPELVNAEEVLLLDSETYEGIGGLLWAPEFHVINGRLYIFHGATPGEFFKEESHLMVLREGGDPMNRHDWSRTQRVAKKDSSDLCEAGKTISLDMTTFEWEGEHYAVWSQREFVPSDLGAWLYIAKLNPDDPWRLLTDPVVLSKPDYGWANNHTHVDEGPFALMVGNKLYLSFSSALVDSTYVVGMITIEKGMDLLNPDCWEKWNYPLLTSRSVEGEYGPGHNAYVTDDDGKVWNTYHARPGLKAPRCSGIRRVHFDVYGEPVLDVTEELDIKPELKNIKTTLVVE